MVAGVDIGFIRMMLMLLRRKTYALVCNTLEIDLFSLLVELDLFLIIKLFSCELSIRTKLFWIIFKNLVTY